MNLNLKEVHFKKNFHNPAHLSTKDDILSECFIQADVGDHMAQRRHDEHSSRVAHGGRPRQVLEGINEARLTLISSQIN